jgi:hypothetical protein
MAKKITKKEIINTMLAETVIKENPMYLEFLTHELELLNNKAKKKTESDKSQEDEVIKEIILEVLATIGKGTVTDIQLADTRVSTDKYRNQRISAILKKMCENDKTVIRTTEKRKAIFYLAKVEEEVEEMEEVEETEIIEE